MLLQDLLGLNLIGVRKSLSIRTLIGFLLLLAGIFIIIDITKMYYKCPQYKIEYRYIPRSFNEEQDNLVPIKAIFGKMFENPSPWINSFTETDSIYKNRSTSNVRQN